MFNTFLQVPTPCRLYVINVDKERVIAERGTIFPSCRQGDNLIHGKRISPQNVKVSVDDVVAKFQITPLPVPCD